jgi:hypothetical protein
VDVVSVQRVGGLVGAEGASTQERRINSEAILEMV